MINKRHNFKIINITIILFLAAMLLTACDGFSFQAQTEPSEDGGISITGDVDPLQSESAPTDTAPAGQTIDTQTLVLLLVGFGFLVLVLLLLVRRSSSDQKSSNI